MKLVMFSTKNSLNLELGVLTDNSSVININLASDHYGLNTQYNSVIDVLNDTNGLENIHYIINATKNQTGPWKLALNKITLAAPIPHPGKILGAAINYYDFCKRGNIEIPTSLKVFAKVPTTVIGTHDTVIVPSERKVTYEGELGVVIGRKGKQIASINALNYVAGYTIINDFTANDYVKKDIQLMRGKNLDTFCPLGPYLVTKDEITNPGSLNIKTEVNSILMQDSNTSQLIFDIPSIIEYFSSFMTLEIGDIIATGTPAGTALQFDPPAFMQHGDVVAVTIEGLGKLVNKIEVLP